MNKAKHLALSVLKEIDKASILPAGAPNQVGENEMNNYK